MLNNWDGQGRLGKNIELRKTAAGKSVASFSIACDRNYKPKDGDRECDWIDIVAWGGLAEFAEKYFKKGDMMIISGRLQISSYDDKNGVRRKATVVVASEINFGGGPRSDGEARPQQTEYPNDNYGYDYGGIDGFMNIPDDLDEELPFSEIPQ